MNQIRFKNAEGRLQFVTKTDLVMLMSIDPAFSKRRDSARTAMPVTGVYGEDIFLLEDFAERGLGAYDIANQALSFVMTYRPTVIFVETINAQTTTLEVLRKEAAKLGFSHLNVEEIPSHGKRDKDGRIWGLEGFFKPGRFHILPRHTNFLAEYSSFPVGDQQDLLDALAFQKDAWERYAGRTGFGGGMDQKRRQLEQQAMDRVRRAVGRHGGY